MQSNAIISTTFVKVLSLWWIHIHSTCQSIALQPNNTRKYQKASNKTGFSKAFIKWLLHWIACIQMFLWHSFWYFNTTAIYSAKLSYLSGATKIVETEVLFSVSALCVCRDKRLLLLIEIQHYHVLHNKSILIVTAVKGLYGEALLLKCWQSRGKLTSRGLFKNMFTHLNHFLLGSCHIARTKYIFFLHLYSFSSLCCFGLWERGRKIWSWSC